MMLNVSCRQVNPTEKASWVGSACVIAAITVDTGADAYRVMRNEICLRIEVEPLRGSTITSG